MRDMVYDIVGSIMNNTNITNVKNDINNYLEKYNENQFANSEWGVLLNMTNDW